MDDDKYERTLDELETHACKWWPKEVQEEVQKLSILETLLGSQEKFISILKLTDKNNLVSIFDLLDASKFSYNLFLKHLMVLVDFGSEPLQRVNKDFRAIFPSNKFVYNIGNGDVEYTFFALPTRGKLTNKRMKIDTVENLRSDRVDVQLCKDLIILLMYGGAAIDEDVRAILVKCTPYEYLGDDAKVENFVRQNYIRVSRIIGGKTASDHGNIAQQYAVHYLTNALGDNYNIRSNGTIPGVTQMMEAH